MSEFEVSFEIDGSQYGERLLLEKYGDQYGIVLAQAGKDNGIIYKRWCYPQKAKERKPADKAIPWRIPLGNRTVAINLLQAMINALVGNEPSNKKDDIPF